ncbi:MAG: glycosyltransferase [Lacibacter sp.]
MNIVILGPAYPLRGGIAAFNERLAHAFQQEGHSVEICSFSLQYPSFLFPGTSQFKSGPAPEGLRITAAVNSINPLNWLQVGRRLQRQRPDLVVVRYWLPFMGPALGTILRRIRKNKHTRIVCIADNVVPHEHRPGDRLFTRYFVGAVDAFITMSQQVLNDLRRFTCKPALLEPHPLYDHFGAPLPQPQARQHLQLPAEGFLFLFFGFIRAYKGLDLLLEALHLLRQKPTAPPCKLLIAGEFYEDRQKYDELIERYRLHDTVIRRTDFIPDEEVRYYVCAADVVVQPYRSATQSGVTPLAYHFEKPMIVTRVGGLPDMVPHEKAGLVCEPTAASLAEALETMLHANLEAYRQGVAAEKQKYAWSNMTRAVLQLAFQ